MVSIVWRRGQFQTSRQSGNSQLWRDDSTDRNERSARRIIDAFVNLSTD